MDTPCVIAAIDLGEGSRLVLERAGRLAAHLRVPCRVVHVLAALSGDEEAGPLLPTLRRWILEAREEAQNALDQQIAEARFPKGLEVVPDLLEGRPFDRILMRARQTGAGLVVVGGPPGGRLLGSTAERVVRKSRGPVLVVRGPEGPPYHRVLVGMDGSDEAARAVSTALELASPTAAVLGLHVLNTSKLPPIAEVREALAVLLDRARSWVAAVALRRPVDVEVEAGSARHVLVERAWAWRADLVAVGCRGRGAVAHVLLGSVAEAAARRAPCDVLVVGTEREGFRLP